MISRTLDATFLNRVANHPEVRPWLGEGPPELDFTAALSNPDNYALVYEFGGWVLHPLGPGVYEIHSMALPEGRGRPVYSAAREMLRWMFTRTDCVEIQTKCPDDNPAARMLANAMGFREWFHRDAAWNVGTPAECGVSFQTLHVDWWAIRDSEALKAGRAFHDVLEAAKKSKESELPIHLDDEAHDRAVGAAWLMVNEGQTVKGVEWYRRWALLAGYAPVEVVGHQTIDIRDAVVEISHGETRILLLR